MITPGFTENAIYVDGDLIDLCMLSYEVQKCTNGATVHRKMQAVTKLRLVAHEVFNGYSSPVDEDTLRNWAKQASV